MTDDWLELEDDVDDVDAIIHKARNPHWYQFQKGRKKTGGRKKGVKNVVTRAVEEALDSVYEGVGGDEALLAFAQDNPDEFFKLWIKMLPRQIKLDGELKTTATMTKAEATELIKQLQTRKTTAAKKTKASRAKKRKT